MIPRILKFVDCYGTSLNICFENDNIVDIPILYYIKNSFNSAVNMKQHIYNMTVTVLLFMSIIILLS